MQSVLCNSACGVDFDDDTTAASSADSELDFEPYDLQLSSRRRSSKQRKRKSSRKPRHDYQRRREHSAGWKVKFDFILLMALTFRFVYGWKFGSNAFHMYSLKPSDKAVFHFLVLLVDSNSSLFNLVISLQSLPISSPTHSGALLCAVFNKSN